MSDILSATLEFIKILLGEPPTDSAIPYFAPFYNLLIILWMAALSAIFVAVFWKRFRGFAAFLIWMAIFLTLIHKGSSSLNVQIDAFSAVFNMSFSIVLLIIFIILTLLIFGGLLGRRRGVPIPG
jgi:hypothetical protein